MWGSEKILKAFRAGEHTSAYTQHFSISCFTSYEVLVLAAPNISLGHCNNLNPATLLPFIMDKVSQDCLTLTNDLLTLHSDLQEIHLRNSDFSCFTDGFFLKETMANIVQDMLLQLLLMLLRQNLYYGYFSPTGWIICNYTGCTLAKDKTANIYPNSRYGFGVTWLWNVMKAIWLSYFQ